MTAESGCIDSALVSQVHDDLAAIDPEIHPGITLNCGQAIESLSQGSCSCSASLRENIAQVADRLRSFQRDLNLDNVVVVNVASTEPRLDKQPYHHDLSRFEACLDGNADEAVRASTIYAYAAIEAGYPYINFTPSSGALFPALVQMAERNRVPVMGNDGKTGETLVKSALAPMFTCRNLEVLSWEGFNILGNMDGRVLSCPENKQSKIQTKDGVLPHILGYQPHSEVHIDYVPSLADQKTAWDFIHFRGFLGARMSLQFIWQGYDSLLAAPLILDLVRLADLAKQRGEAGLMPHLACFFKAPMGVDEHRLYEQYQMLSAYAVSLKNPSDA
jgi:myo-inositol-1-phosphate synthase